MSIEEGWMPLAERCRRLASRAACGGLVITGLALAACTGEEAPAADVESGMPEAEAAAATQETAAPATVADLFPAAPERDMVLANCATCHAVACAAMGQRTANRWNDLEAAHREHVPNLSDEDRQRIFAYLRENFNDSRPEPMIPPEFLDRGCTPF